MRYKILFALIALLSFGCSKTETPENKRTAEVSLRLVYPPETHELMVNLTSRAQGAGIKLELIPTNAVSAAGKIASGEIKTEAWLAPMTGLVAYTNSNIVNLGAPQVNCQPIFATPVVIAAQERFISNFKDRARYFSWNDFFEISNAGAKAAEAGSEKQISYTAGMIDMTASGLPSLLQLLHFSRTLKSKPLDSSIFSDQKAMERFKEYVSNISYYAPKEKINLEKAAGFHGHLYFAFTTERELVLYNHAQSDVARKLYALYPIEGSVWLDYNLCLSNADWVVPTQKAAFGQLAEIAKGSGFQQTAVAQGFRPATDDSASDLSGLSANGALAEKLTVEPAVVGDGVIAHAVKNVDEMLRPFAAVYLIDISGTTQGLPLSAGKRLMRALLASSTGKNLSALVSFADEIAVRSDFSNQHSNTIAILDKLEASGGSALYDAIAQAVRMITKDELRAYRRNLYIFTDGNDNRSSMSIESLIDLITEMRRHYDVNVEFVALEAPDTNFRDVERIARALNANFYRTRLESIDKVITGLVSLN